MNIWVWPFLSGLATTYESSSLSRRVSVFLVCTPCLGAHMGSPKLPSWRLWKRCYFNYQAGSKVCSRQSDQDFSHSTGSMYSFKAGCWRRITSRFRHNSSVPSALSEAGDSACLPGHQLALHAESCFHAFMM